MRILVLALLATPAAAQDITAQFEAARSAFTVSKPEDLAPDAAIIALLPTLVGNWVPATLLFLGSPFDAEVVAQACDRSFLTLAPAGARSFTLTSGGRASPLPVRYDYVIGNTFQRSASEADILAWLAYPEDHRVPPETFMQGGWRGEVMLFHPSPDILVLAAPEGLTTIYTRCP